MKPIHRRPLDLGLVLCFSISVLYGFLFSLPEGLGVPVSADSPWPPLRALHDWAVAEEPAHLDPPPNLIAATLFDGFFQAPALLFVMIGLVAAAPLVASARSRLCRCGGHEHVLLLRADVPRSASAAEHDLLPGVQPAVDDRAGDPGRTGALREGPRTRVGLSAHQSPGRAHGLGVF